MAKMDLLPYKQDGMATRYVDLFGEAQGLSIWGQHRFDTFEFEVRFPDKLILTSAIARYALFGFKPFPGRQPDAVAEDILNSRHPFNVLFGSDGSTLTQSTHPEVVRAAADRKYHDELQAGDIRAFGTLSDGIPVTAAYELVEDVRMTLEQL